MTKKALGVSLERNDEDTLSFTSSRARGPTPTSFLSMRDLLFHFSQAHDEVQDQATETAKEAKEEPTLPTTKQRLNSWATRYQTATQSSVGSFSSNQFEGLGAKKRKQTNLSSAPIYKMQEDDAPTNQEPRVPQLGETDRQGRSLRTNMRITRTSMSKLIGNDEIHAASRTILITHTSHGVTLDASIAEVSILIDPTMIRTTKESRDGSHEPASSKKSSPARSIQTIPDQAAALLSPLENDADSTVNLFPTDNGEVAADSITDF